MNVVLYQIIPQDEGIRLLYNSLEYIKKSCGGKVPAEFYESVFSGEIEAQNLSEVYGIFNGKYPEGYKGRSMSVSDVLEIIDSSGNSKFFFCDYMGYHEISFEKESARRNAL